MISTAALTIADDWVGAWDVVAWVRPRDWREVAPLVRWDVATLAATWVHLEAAAESATEQVVVRREADRLADVIAADLPFFLGVSPTMPDADLQPQLPLLLPDDPPLEPLDERPDDLSWRLYFWMVLREHVDRIVDRAGGGPASDPRDAIAVRARDLCERLVEQVAFQVEWILRSQAPAVLPLLEESLAVRVDDAALGAALHIETDRSGAPVALRLVSHDGRSRGAIRTHGRPDSPLGQLIANAAR